MQTGAEGIVGRRSASDSINFTYDWIFSFLPLQKNKGNHLIFNLSGHFHLKNSFSISNVCNINQLCTVGTSNIKEDDLPLQRQRKRHTEIEVNCILLLVTCTLVEGQLQLFPFQECFRYTIQHKRALTAILCVFKFTG